MQSYIQPKLIELVDEASRVLDIGCGDGNLLQKLVASKNIKPLGIEIDQEAIVSCVGKKIPVIQLNINEGLKIFHDNQFDLTILRYTIQEILHPQSVLKEMLRISKRCIVVFSNFTYWKIRLSLLLKGEMPITNEFPYEWFNSPNINLMSVADIKNLCRSDNIRVLNQYYYGHSTLDKLIIKLGYPNFAASAALLHLEKMKR